MNCRTQTYTPNSIASTSDIPARTYSTTRPLVIFLVYGPELKN